LSHSSLFEPRLANVCKINISFPTQTGTTYEYSLDPLFAPIDASASTFNITATKVELVLKKQMAGRQWKTLEGTEAPASTPSEPTEQDPVRQAVLAAHTKAPAYPTSSKKGAKDWDKVVDDIAKSSKGDADKEGMGDFDDDEDPQNAFFKHLYQNADEDTRRAINKSYQESGGTVLSTNWEEVSKAPVEVSPPDGMVAKKWGE
jgi:suppressor of G2 allele of SKP1